VMASDRLAEDLHLDSLAMVQLQSALETHFGLELDDAVWEQVMTVGDVRGLLDRHQSGAVRRAAPTLVAIPANQPSNDVPSPTAPNQKERIVFPRWPWWPLVRLARIGFLEVVMRPLVWLLLGPRIAPRLVLAQPSLLIANHLTAVDVPVILYALSASDRDHVAVAMSGQLLTGWRRGKAERHRIIAILTPVAYWLVTAFFNVFPLPRAAGLRQSFAHAGEALDHGYHVLVFPEGGRSRDGRLQPFEPGIGLLAQESEVPVQPIFLAGLGQQEGKRWPNRGTVSVRLGEPLMMAAGEEPQAFTRRLQAAVAQLEH
jgi:long-chain acyl-CoA synthetase